MLPVAAACSQDPPCWSRACSIDPDGWLPDQLAVFAPDSDALSKRPSRAVVFLRYSANASVATLPLQLEAESTSDLDIDTITMRLFSKDGIATANPAMGLVEIRDTIPLRRHPAPGWTLVISPLPTHDPPKGIISVGVALLP